MLDDGLLTKFIDRFYGYGSFAAPIWFVGMEEGGGDDLEDITKRTTAWNQRGRLELEDVYEYHKAIGETSRWGERATLQTTWGKLIRVFLNAQRATSSTGELTVNQLIAFQRDVWGRQNHTTPTCVIELLPLPSPSTARWLYSTISTLPQLADRPTYRKAVSKVRIKHIQARIAENRPAAVVFYGLAYLNYWQVISGGVLALDQANGYYFGRRESTTFIAAKHPAARGVTNAYFEAVGERLRK